MQIMQMSRLFPLAQRQLNSTQINPSMQSLYSIFRLISDRDGLRDSMVSRFLDDSHWILIGFSLDSHWILIGFFGRISEIVGGHE